MEVNLCRFLPFAYAIVRAWIVVGNSVIKRLLRSHLPVSSHNIFVSVPCQDLQRHMSLRPLFLSSVN